MELMAWRLCEFARIPTCALEQVAFTDIAGAMWNMRARGTYSHPSVSHRRVDGTLETSRMVISMCNQIRSSTGQNVTYRVALQRFSKTRVIRSAVTRYS